MSQWIDAITALLPGCVPTSWEAGAPVAARLRAGQLLEWERAAWLEIRVVLERALHAKSERQQQHVEEQARFLVCAAHGAGISIAADVC